MNTADRISTYLEKLDGISYFDWLKLRQSVDRLFDKQKNEQERHLELALSRDTDKLIP